MNISIWNAAFIRSELFFEKFNIMVNGNRFIVESNIKIWKQVQRFTFFAFTFMPATANSGLLYLIYFNFHLTNRKYFFSLIIRCRTPKSFIFLYIYCLFNFRCLRFHLRFNKIVLIFAINSHENENKVFSEWPVSSEQH